jgi:SPOR domain
MTMESKRKLLLALIGVTFSFMIYQLTQIFITVLNAARSPETEYVQLVDQYHIAKMRRLLLEEQLALAKTKEKIANLAHLIEKNDYTGIAMIAGKDSLLRPASKLIEDGIVVANRPAKLKAENVMLSFEQAKTFEQLEAYMVTKQSLHPQPYTPDEKGLLAMPSENYTLQLMGVRDINELKKFINVNHLENNALIFHTYYLNRDWYVLIYGSYQNHTEALKAIEGLPVSIKELKPWIRQIGSVHKAIALYR